MISTLGILLVAGVISGSGISPPDIKGFTQILSKELEFRIDDCKTGFVGRMVDYQNPNDPNENVRVYYRQVAIVSERACGGNASREDGRDNTSVSFSYHKKEETEVLNRVQRAIDAFAYVQWRTVRDPRTGQDTRTGPMRFWLLSPSGAYADYSQPENINESALKYSPFSEPSDDGSVMVGLEFVLGDTIHIVRIDQDDVSVLAKEAKNEKD